MHVRIGASFEALSARMEMSDQFVFALRGRIV